ncbi:MAG: zf-TFIIB domain-containing protein [Gemmatimonadaceae bacterium]
MWQPDKPSQNENEYFARRDAEWLKEQRALLDAQRAAKAQEMICPRCGAVMAHRPFRGVTLDACGSCHGVWLDAGELAMLAHEPEQELLRLARNLDGTGT